ncbi:unnamed protein product (macronuclear) [Paramecium tetraurelia]|uniref:Kelch motif family protein n=1 Tax=Paramecium tetraurelia TaxID=5888 RepID=A0D447_PARTE|nr:uncharacterized protein GSPATT00013280001 [Paramecium tetraurelia]CAK77814.1 unnamed protein product [Paramecium tetraurelia]|eukprot:XP_001445211.1 hypothetical protein (macronuclear) [Paramecium tetraurelia strain d4-2]
MSYHNNSSFFETSQKSQKILDRLMSALSNQDQDQSYYDMKQILDELNNDQFEKQKEQTEEIKIVFTPHKCQKIAEIEKELENLMIQITNMQVCDSVLYQSTLQKIKQVRKVITQIVDKYFANLKNQYNFVANELVQIHLAPIKQQIFQLRKDIPNYEEAQYNEVLERHEQIKEDLHQLRSLLPKEINLQITNQSLYDIKDSLYKLISLKFKDQFKIVPSTFSGFKQQKKNLLTLKSKTGHLKFQEQQNSIYTFRNNTIYHSHIDYIDNIKQQELVLNDDNFRLTYCNLINTNQSLYFIGQFYQDINTKQFKISQMVTKYNKQENKIEMMSELPIISYGGQAIKQGQFIYYWGGYILVDNVSIGNKKGFKYLINGNKWEQIESMKYPRIKGQCCLLDEKICITGGMMNQYQGNALIEIFSTNQQRFLDPIELVNSFSYVPQVLGYSFPISNQEIFIMGGYNQFGNDGNAQLINLFLKTIQKNSNVIQRIQNVNCTQPIIFKQQIYLLNSEDRKIELIQINADTLQVKNIIPIQ